MFVAKLSITFFLQMAIILAIVTTLMASPIFEAIYGTQARASGELGALESTT